MDEIESVSVASDLSDKRSKDVLRRSPLNWLPLSTKPKCDVKEEIAYYKEKTEELKKLNSIAIEKVKKMYNLHKETFENLQSMRTDKFGVGFCPSVGRGSSISGHLTTPQPLRRPVEAVSGISPTVSNGNSSSSSRPKPPPPPPKKLPNNNKNLSESLASLDINANLKPATLLLSDKTKISNGSIVSRKSSRSTLEPEFSLIDYLQKFPHGGDIRFINTKLVFQIKNLDSPIGIALLPSTQIVIGVTKRNEVHIYSQQGKLVRIVEPGRPFRRPSDMVALPGGRFAVRDDHGIQLFDEEGVFIRTLADRQLGRAFGLATDGKGRVITINTNAFGNFPNITRKGEIDLLFIDVESSRVIDRVELVDVIPDLKKSKCRFLQCDGKKIYIADLGLDCVYVLSMPKNVVRTFGESGKNPGQLGDPAGLVVDSYGNTIVADAGNHRLQVFDRTRNYVGPVKTIPAVNRPSGILLDPVEAAIYVLNLRGNSMAKYKLVK